MVNPGSFPRASFRAVLEGTYSRADANAFALLCQALAAAAVRRRNLKLRLCHPSAVLDEHDVIQECFLQLFRRDGMGRFIEVNRFFGKYCPDHAGAPDELLLGNLRRLIAAKVGFGVVSVLCKSDPGLCRILRNLRLGIRSTSLFEMFERFGEDYIRPGGIPPRLHLECIPLQAVRDHLHRRVTERDGTPAMLRHVHEVLSEVDEHQPAVPLVPLGIIVRGVYAETGTAAPVVLEPEISDLARLLPGVLQRLRDTWEQSYVQRGKLTREEFRAVMACLEVIVPDTCGDGGSYFECLKERIPALTREEYAAKYRTILEYLARCARKELAAQLRR